MLRVNVGISRKLSKDYNSSGFSINLEGEVSAPVSDPEAVIEEVKELYDLAEEAVARQIERSQSVDAIASHDESPRSTVAPNGHSHQNGDRRPPTGNGESRREEPATNKQIQYLLSIGKRMRLSTVQLEREIEQILGKPVGLYDLTKAQAGSVINSLTNAVGGGRDRA